MKKPKNTLMQKPKNMLASDISSQEMTAFVEKQKQNITALPLPSTTPTTSTSPPIVDLHESFRRDQHKNWTSVLSYALRGFYSDKLDVQGTIRDKREVCVWIMRQRDEKGRREKRWTEECKQKRKELKECIVKL